MFKIDLHLLDEKLSHLPWKDSRRDYMRRQNAHIMCYKVKVSDFNDSLAMKVSDIPNNSVSGCSRD